MKLKDVQRYQDSITEIEAELRAFQAMINPDGVEAIEVCAHVMLGDDGLCFEASKWHGSWGPTRLVMSFSHLGIDLVVSEGDHCEEAGWSYRVDLLPWSDTFVVCSESAERHENRAQLEAMIGRELARLKKCEEKAARRRMRFA